MRHRESLADRLSRRKDRFRILCIVTMSLFIACNII